MGIRINMIDKILGRTIKFVDPVEPQQNINSCKKYSHSV